MSVLDKALEFSDAQALASVSSGGSVKCTNQVDSRNNVYKNTWGASIDAELGFSKWVVSVNTALVGAGAAIRAQLVTKEADASISSGGTVIAEIFVPAVSAAGWRKSIEIGPGTSFKRYVGVVYSASGAKLTSAKFDSWLALDHAEKYD